MHWPLCTAMQWNAKECKGHLFLAGEQDWKGGKVQNHMTAEIQRETSSMAFRALPTIFPYPCTNCPLLDLTIILWHKNFSSRFCVRLTSKSSFILSVTWTDYVIISLFSTQDTPYGGRDTIAYQKCMFCAEYKESVWEGSNELESKSRRPLQPFFWPS